MQRLIPVARRIFFSVFCLALPASQGQPPPIIRVPVRVVETPVIATNKGGLPVHGMEREDFRLYDNDRRQVVRLDSADEPLSLAIVVQTNGDVRAWLPEVRRAKSALESSLVGANGEASLTVFNDEIRRVQTMTGNFPALDAAFDSLKPMGYKARCLDALMDAAAQLEDVPRARRRVILLIGQPFDSGSAAKLGDVIRRTELDNIAVYQLAMPRVGFDLLQDTVAVSKIHGLARGNGTGIMGSVDLGRLIPPIVQGKDTASGQDQLAILTGELGGRRLPFRTLRDFEAGIAAIGEELHTAYALSFSPDNAAAGYHRIRVETSRADVILRTRPGYYAE